VEIYTIGFTQRSAREFFETLKRAAVRRVIDVRLTNTSQLAGFAKREDLEYFLQELCDAEYRHELLLSPTKELRDAHRKKLISWDEYESGFLELLAKRNVEQLLDRHLFDDPTVLLCSEPEPHHCHRRLVAEYLRAKWNDVTVVHL